MGGRFASPGFRPARRLLQKSLHFYWRFARPVTLGVRAALLDDERGVFLVRHTYTPGWYLPGGGVEAGETVLEALVRECAEEGHIEFDEHPQLHGIFHNLNVSRRDHVAVYVVRRFHQTAERRPDMEIAEARFFPLDGLPKDMSTGSRARLAEILGEAPVSHRW